MPFRRLYKIGLWCWFLYVYTFCLHIASFHFPHNIWVFAFVRWNSSHCEIAIILNHTIAQKFLIFIILEINWEITKSNIYSTSEFSRYLFSLHFSRKICLHQWTNRFFLFDFLSSFLIYYCLIDFSSEIRKFSRLLEQ